MYGRFRLEVCREDGRWIVYRTGPGSRTRVDNITIPAEIRTAREIARYLDDLYHEAARPDRSVSVIAD